MFPGWMQIALVALLVVLLFGRGKISALMGDVAKGITSFKKGMKDAGFDIIDGDSAIVPVMLYDAKLSQNMADMLLDEGIYVIGFFYFPMAQ